MEELPSLIGGHFHRLSWLGRIHGLAVWSRIASRPPARCRCRPRGCPAACRAGGADRAGRRDHLRQRAPLARPAPEPPPARAHRRRVARQAVGHHRRLQRRRARSCCRASTTSARASRRTMPATSCRSGSTAAWRTGSPAALPMRWTSAHPTTGRSGWSCISQAGACAACGRGPSTLDRRTGGGWSMHHPSRQGRPGGGKPQQSLPPISDLKLSRFIHLWRSPTLPSPV